MSDLLTDLIALTEDLRAATDTVPASDQMVGAMTALSSVVAELDDLIEKHQEEGSGIT